MLIAQVMSAPAVTVGPDDTVKGVAALLAGRGFAAVPVVDADGDLIGIVSEADLLALAADGDPEPPSTARGLMRPGVFSVPADAPASTAVRLMLQRGFRSLPVVDGTRVVGMVSRRDLVRALARDDAEVRAEVAEAVAGQARLLAAVQVTVEGGLVTLTVPAGLPGAVGRLLEELAAEVPGVIAVRQRSGAGG